MSWNAASLIGKTSGLRSTLRRTGLLKHMAALRPLLVGSGYEARVDAALTSVLRPGDVVWDVGANVGVYTARFAEAVGPSGRVVAFEPIETTFATLEDRIEQFAHATAHMVALGASRATIEITLNDEPNSPTNSLANVDAAPGSHTQSVDVEVGDLLVAEGVVPVPSVVKIDTEGFEEDVLWGMRSTLRDENLRALLIEVHFALLEERGYRRAPDRISSTLQDAGFSLKWVDPSHLLAMRR